MCLSLAVFILSVGQARASDLQPTPKSQTRKKYAAALKKSQVITKAADSSTAPTRSPQIRPNATNRDLAASLVYSSAHQLIYKGNTSIFGAPTSFRATEQTTSAFGVSGAYAQRSPYGIGFSAGLTFEFVRKSQGISGSAGSSTISGSYNGNSGTNLFAAGVNANYSIGTDVYVFAGVNCPLTFAMQRAESLSALPGYQAGLGYALTDRWSLEAYYRVVRMKGSLDAAPLSLKIDELTFPGSILGVQLLF